MRTFQILRFAEIEINPCNSTSKQGTKKAVLCDQTASEQKNGGDGCKTVIHQPEAIVTELDPETMSPLQKAVIQGFQYRDMLESGKVATVSELAQKVKQERAFLFRALSLVNLAFGHHRSHPQRHPSFAKGYGGTRRTRNTHFIQTPQRLPRRLDRAAEDVWDGVKKKSS